MGFSSVAFDPGDIATNSDAASSALAEANSASSAAAALKQNITDMDVSPNSNHTANGPQTDDINAGESVAAGECVYLHSDGEWHLTDADAAASADGMLAISLEAKVNGSAMNVALPGSFVRNDSWAWTAVGVTLYLDTSAAGGFTETAPSGEDDVVRIAGYATHTDRMYFSPLVPIVYAE